jgi:magnesium chelatase family protein
MLIESIILYHNNACVIVILLHFPIRHCIALHLCPCGYYGDPVRPCTCSPGIVTKYQKRISGLLLDRIDIHIEVPQVEYNNLSDQRLGEPSAAIQSPSKENI